MSDIILGGDFTVYYEAENRQKRLEWTGSATGTRSANEVYSALQDQFDELGQMDDGTPMSAQTPTEYTIGIIDAGDDDPWYIDPVSVEHLTGGALKTASWTRDLPGDGTGNTGIVRVQVAGLGTIVAGDIGNDIVHDVDSDAGTLLYIETVGSNYYLWVRPDDNALANDFNSTSGTLTCNAHTSGAQSAASETGESLWANVYSIGSIQDNTHLYVIQDSSKLVSEESGATVDWWSDGHVDVLLKVKEIDTELDEAVVQVFARQYSKTYSHFEVDLSNGGRNPIPLATGSDLDNTSGYGLLNCSGGTGTFTVGDMIGDTDSQATATKLGIITAVAGTGTDPDIDYYLIGDLTDFVNTDTLYNIDDTGQADIDTVGTTGPASLAGLSIAYGNDETFDIDESGTPERYSIVIDCSDERLTDVYEWSKWLTMRGQTAQDTNTDDMDGEQYIGSDYKLAYTTQTGVWVVGEQLWMFDTSDNLMATGIVVADDDNGTTGNLVFRNTRIYSTATTITKIGDNVEYASVTDYAVVGSYSTITPISAAPLGTFAGGKWFCAPGVVLDNVNSLDANNFQLTDDDGNVVSAPTKVSLTVGNSRLADKIAVFRLDAAGGEIKKDEYNATVHAIGDATLLVGASIVVDTPGKATGGIVRLNDVTGFQEYRLRYSSWDTATFTLANKVVTTDDTGGTTTTTNVHVSGSDFTTSLKVGDLVLNITQSNAVSYVTAITDDDNAVISPAITGQASGDTVEFNAIPVITTTSDEAYVPLIDVYETTGTTGSPGSEGATVTYDVDIPVRIRARNAGDILPYEADSTVTDTGMSNNIIRTADSIYN